MHFYHFLGEDKVRYLVIINKMRWIIIRRKAGFKMAFSLPGVHLPHRKNTKDMPAVRIDTPKSVTISMSMHIGKPAIPTVKVGDTVKIGTVIGKPDGFVSAYVHSSVSGTVKKIDEILASNGNMVKAVIIETDGEQSVDESLCKRDIGSYSELVDAIRDGGIVGLGGAGFPTSVKFDFKDPVSIDELIVNCAECEPYITSDTRTMIDRTDELFFAIELFKKHLNIKKVILGIEDNKKEAIKILKDRASALSDVEVKVLSSVYPQGGEKVLVYHTTGKVIKSGEYPLSVGCVVCNCTTLADIARFINTGMPLVEKCVTVDGSAVSEPKNVLVPIGTSLEDVFNFCGGFKSEVGKVIYGGPMMGITVPDLSAPIMKHTNAILAFNEKDSVLAKPVPCIRCGRCINSCPFGINPPAIAKGLREKNYEDMIRFGAENCMECGCCSFVCPASRPLVQNNKLAKAELKEYRAKQKEKEAK